MDTRMTDFARLYHVLYEEIIKYLNSHKKDKNLNFHIDAQYIDETGKLQDYVEICVNKDLKLIKFIIKKTSKEEHIKYNDYDKINNIADCIALRYCYHTYYKDDLIHIDEIYNPKLHRVFFGNNIQYKQTTYRIKIYEDLKYS